MIAAENDKLRNVATKKTKHKEAQAMQAMKACPYCVQGPTLRGITGFTQGWKPTGMVVVENSIPSLKEVCKPTGMVGVENSIPSLRVGSRPAGMADVENHSSTLGGSLGRPP